MANPAWQLVAILALVTNLFCVVFADEWFKDISTGVPLTDHSATITIDGRYLLLFGGFDGFGTYRKEMSKYDLQEQSWNVLSHINEPQTRIKHSAIQTTNNRMVLFGGHNENSPFLNQLLVYDTDADQWLDVPQHGVSPVARVGHSAGYSASQNVMYVFGGYNSQGRRNDVQAYNLNTNTWSDVECTGELPEARSEAAATVIGDKLYVFGGRRWWGYDGLLNDLFELSLTTFEWKKIAAHGDFPSKRVGAGLVPSQDGKFLLLFGGWGEDLYPRDVRRFEFETGTWSVEQATGEPMEPRYKQSTTVFGNIVYIFGGYHDYTHQPVYLDDLNTYVMNE